MTRLLIPFLGLLAALDLHAIQFPAIPSSTRVLTAEEVQNYWFNTLRRTSIPSKPSSLYPRKQAAWEAALRARKAQLRSILEGQYREAAELAALRHNIEAYRNLGDAAKLAEAEQALRDLREHHARLALLRTQRQTAERVADAADRVAGSTSSAHHEVPCPEPAPVAHPEPCPSPVSVPCPPSPPTPPSEPYFPPTSQRPLPRG